jgi:hypothetical protein
MFSPTRVHHGAPSTQPFVCQAGSGPYSHFSCAESATYHQFPAHTPGSALEEQTLESLPNTS